jgi:hypothetical protein
MRDERRGDNRYACEQPGATNDMLLGLPLNGRVARHGSFGGIPTYARKESGDDRCDRDVSLRR